MTMYDENQFHFRLVATVVGTALIVIVEVVGVAAVVVVVVVAESYIKNF